MKKGLSRRSVLMGAAGVVAAKQPPFFDGQTILLDGCEFVLTDIIAPGAAPLPGKAEPGADLARAALESVLSGKRMPAFVASPRDRWGRQSGPLRLLDAAGRETILQAALLEAGAARVFPQSDDLERLDVYFSAEEAARSARRGLWSIANYAVHDARDAQRRRGFQIYRGVIRSTGENKGRVYFNFGEDFRTDVTASAASGAFRRWARQEPLAAYAGREVELRGLAEWINGPSIALRHERQLRLV